MARTGEDLALLPGGRYVTSAWLRTPDQIGFPLHVIEGRDILS